jgi:hypothetical protein
VLGLRGSFSGNYFKCINIITTVISIIISTGFIVNLAYILIYLLNTQSIFNNTKAIKFNLKSILSKLPQLIQQYELNYPSYIPN